MNCGYVKLWRSVLDSGLKQCPAAGHLFWYLLASASYAPQKVFISRQLTELPAGTVVTGRVVLSKELNLSERQIRTALQQLEQMGIITIKTTNKFSIISFEKWDSYNEEQPVERPTNDQQMTNKRPTNDQQMTTLKEVKNLRKREDINLTYTASGDAGRAQDASQEKVLKGRKKTLRGKRAEAFERFWEAFAYRKDKARAIDAWAAIPTLTDALVDTICLSAEREAERRPELVASGRTPIYAQGWISGRRWEDEEQTAEEKRGFKLL